MIMELLYQLQLEDMDFFVDAKKLLPHIPYNEFRGQALAIRLYIEAGIRTCDIGSYMLLKQSDTGEQLKAEFEFTRLAIPRGVTHKHTLI